MVELGLFILGAAFGSFSLALAYRLRHKLNFVSDRSVCEHCGHVLGATDLIPVFSWLALKGRCRYCRKPLSPKLILSELGLGLVFAASFALWPLGISTCLEITYFGLWLLICTLFSTLFWYDVAWMVLPNKVVYPLIFLSLVDYGLAAVMADSFGFGDLGLLAAAIGVASGVFLLFYASSGGKWIGFGDVRLGIALGFLAARPELAALNIFLASVIGTVLVLPVVYLATGKMIKKLPFGPLLIIAALIVRLFGQRIIDWYLGTTGL